MTTTQGVVNDRRTHVSLWRFVFLLPAYVVQGNDRVGAIGRCDWSAKRSDWTLEPQKEVLTAARSHTLADGGPHSGARVQWSRGRMRLDGWDPLPRNRSQNPAGALTFLRC